MAVLDACAVIAFLRDEPSAAPVATLLAEPGTALTSIGLAEVIDTMVRVVGADLDEFVLELHALRLGEAHPVDSVTGATAGRLRARSYRRRHCEVSMTDCVAAATAQRRGEALATSDPDLLDLCHSEDIAVIPLPGSDGALWTPGE